MRTRRPTAIALAALAALSLLAGCKRSQDTPVSPENPNPQAQSNAPNGMAPAPATPAPENPAPVARAPRRERTAPREAGLEREAGTGHGGSMAEAPAVAPEPVRRTVPAGTALDIEFIDGVSSRDNKPGDSFRARVIHDVAENGSVVIPADSIVDGTVTEAVPLKKIGGQARLGLEFTRLELAGGGTATIHASLAQLGKSETGRDAATIGGAAAGGAILGRVLSHSQANRNTVIGAVVGAAAGTAIAAHSKGQEVVFPAGTTVSVKLDQPTDVLVRR